MRILFTFVGGDGHFEPLVPIARAAEAAGHLVAFAGRPDMVATVEAAGLRAFATTSYPGGSPRRLPLRELDPEREDRVLRAGFAGAIARGRVRDVLALCAEWRPDLLVCDEIDFGSGIAAERLGLPHATVLVIASGSFVRPVLVAEPLDALRAAHGLAPDPQLARLRRHLVLSPFPPSLREPAFPLPPAAHSIRLDPDGAGGDPLASWAARRAGAPLVYLTLGTVFNLESGDLFSRALAGLRDLPVGLVVTVGRQLDPEELGPQPANVHLARYIPQSSLLPRCDLVVSHGGSGSVLGALAHGLPMVLLPIGADQPRNAARCAELGIARVLDAVAATPEHVAEAVSAALADPGARRAAERMRDELAALPGPAHAVHLLERLAEDERRECP